MFVGLVTPMPACGHAAGTPVPRRVLGLCPPPATPGDIHLSYTEPSNYNEMANRVSWRPLQVSVTLLLPQVNN